MRASVLSFVIRIRYSSPSWSTRCSGCWSTFDPRMTEVPCSPGISEELSLGMDLVINEPVIFKINTGIVRAKNQDLVSITLTYYDTFLCPLNVPTCYMIMTCRLRGDHRKTYASLALTQTLNSIIHFLETAPSVSIANRDSCKIAIEFSSQQEGCKIAHALRYQEFVEGG